MAKPQSLDFDVGGSPDPSPDKTLPVKSAAVKPSVPAKPAKRKPADVVCQRCNLACEPIKQSHGWVKCPKCGWKHKTFTALAAAKQARRTQQNKAAR